MQKSKYIRFRNSYAIFFLILCGCLTKTERQEKSGFCDRINEGSDLYSYWMKKESYDSLLTIVEGCVQTPRVISARLNLLSLLGRDQEALRLLSTLNHSDFMTPYDSISYLNYFKSRLSGDTIVKKKLQRQTLGYISAYLKEKPTDSLALFHYCGTALEILSEQELYEKIDSMARQNKFDGVFELAVSAYLSNYLGRYKKNLEEYKKAKVI